MLRQGTCICQSKVLSFPFITVAFSYLVIMSVAAWTLVAVTVDVLVDVKTVPVVFCTCTQAHTVLTNELACFSRLDKATALGSTLAGSLLASRAGGA